MCAMGLQMFTVAIMLCCAEPVCVRLFTFRVERLPIRNFSSTKTNTCLKAAEAIARPSEQVHRCSLEKLVMRSWGALEATGLMYLAEVGSSSSMFRARMWTAFDPGRSDGSNFAKATSPRFWECVVSTQPHPCKVGHVQSAKLAARIIRMDS